MWFPSTCPDFCLVGVDLMVSLKNIWTVWFKKKKKRQADSVPNRGQFYSEVVVEDSVPTLLFLLDTSLPAPSSL